MICLIKNEFHIDDEKVVSCDKDNSAHALPVFKLEVNV